MNILQILPSLDVGGVETGTVDLARYLVKNGHKAIVVSGGGRLVRELDAIGARHYSLPVGKKSFFTVISMIGKLEEIIRKEDIDIVHARSRVPALIAYFACKMSNRVLITTAHGYYKKHPLSESMGWGKRVIVASNIMAKHMADNFGVPHERIRLIARGVDVSRFKFTDPAERRFKYFTIGMVSRITPLKGHADFIKAVSLLRRKIPALKALVVGSPGKLKYLEDLRLLARRLGLDQVVEFVPATGDVPAVMNSLNVLVSATVTPEAFGRSIIEAQASGVPVVSTRVGGVVDIIDDGKTGFFCAIHDPKDMADKIFSIFKNKELSSHLAVEARKKVDAYFKSDMMMEKTVAVYEEALKKTNILVIKTSATGDVILSVPSLRAIRQRFPDADIKVLVGLASREVLDRCPYVNGLIVCDFKGKHRTFSGMWKLSSELRKDVFDIAIDLQNSRRSHILGFMSLASRRYGYSNKKFSFLLNNSIKDDAPYLDPVDHQMRILKLAGVKTIDKTLEMWPSDEDIKKMDRMLEESWAGPKQSLVGINVRASAKWISKNWPPSNMAQFCDRLAGEFNARVVLTGTSSDIEVGDLIARLTRSKPINAIGKTGINELAGLMKRFKVYITPDSGPMHVANAAGTPCVALFGPTDPKRHFLSGEGHVLITRQAEFKCAPCYKPNCQKKINCMKKITVDEVFDAVRPYLISRALKAGEFAEEGAA